MECQIKELRKSYYKLERFRKGDDDKDLTVKGKNVYFRIMQKYKIDYLTQGQKIEGESLQKSCYVLEARLNNPFIKGVEQYKRIVICRK